MGHLFTKPKSSKQYSYSSSKVDQLSSFENDILNAHNKTRQNAGLPKLSWDVNQAKKAKQWNEYLKQNENCTIRHPLNSEKEKQKYLPNNMGQNLYVGHGYPDKPTQPELKSVESWYNECKDYSIQPGQEIPSNFSDVGHFTQLQWKDTKKVGCDIIDCPKEIQGFPAQGSIVTCNYDKGNIGSQFQDQVKYKDCPINLSTTN